MPPHIPATDEQTPTTKEWAFLAGNGGSWVRMVMMTRVGGRVVVRVRSAPRFATTATGPLLRRDVHFALESAVVVSGGGCTVDDGVQYLGGGLSVQDFSWAAVELVLDGLDLGVGDAVEVGALGEVLADQAVGVLVGGTLPGAVGIGEVDLDVGGEGESGVVGHLRALIPGDGGVHGPGQGVDHALEGVGDGAGAVVVRQTGDQHEPAATLHQSDQGAAGGRLR